MPEPIISAEFLRELDVLMSAEVASGRLPYAVLAERAKSIGFISTRIFMVGDDDINESSFFLPTFIYPTPSKPEHTQCDIKTEDGFAEGQVKRLPPQVTRAVLSDGELNCGLRKLHEAIGINGKFSYVVPIRRDERLIGKLSLSVDAETDQLGLHEDAALLLMSSMLETHLTAYLDSKLEIFRTKIWRDKKSTRTTQIEQFTTKILGHFQDAVGGYISAAFMRSWTNNTVFKIGENCTSSIVCDRFDEVYDYGRNLTGIAFSRDLTLSVIDIDKLDASQKYSVEEQSYERHVAILGSSVSVLYAKVETEFHELVFRVFCKRHDYCRAFDVNDVYLVKNLAQAASELLTSYWSDRSIHLLQELSETSIRSLGNIDRLMEQFGNALAETNNFSMAFVGRQANSERVEFSYGLPENLSGDAMEHIQFIELDALANGKFWTIAPLKMLRHASDLTSDTSVATHFHMIKMSNEDLDCYLFLFVRSNSNRNEIRDAISTKTQEVMQIFSALVSSTLGSKIRHLDIDDAKRLIGQVGHELEEPIAQYQSKALKGYLLLENKLAEKGFPASLSKDLTPIIDQAKIDMERRQNEIADMLNLAISMAQSTDAEIDVNFTQENLEALIDQKKEFVNRKALELHSRPAELSTSGFIGKNAILDLKLFEKILDNLLMNAVKYSNPPGIGRKLEVFCRYSSTSSHHILTIENWGIPLKRSEFETVFSPFKRGSAKDKIKSRRGMGLGLYIARRFARAHNGDVVCSGSTATFDDPLRRETEGFRTVFEVKIDKYLSLGPHTIGI